MSFREIYKLTTKFVNNLINSKLSNYLEMKRAIPDVEIDIIPKKLKLSKEEKKQLYKEKRKIKQREVKTNTILKDYYSENCEYYYENGLRKVILLY